MCCSGTDCIVLQGEMCAAVSMICFDVTGVVMCPRVAATSSYDTWAKGPWFFHVFIYNLLWLFS